MLAFALCESKNSKAKYWVADLTRCASEALTTISANKNQIVLPTTAQQDLISNYALEILRANVQVVEKQQASTRSSRHC